MARIEIRDGKEFRVTVVPQGVTKVPPLTKFPFRAYISGSPVTVWPDWIEWEEADEE